MSHPYIAASSEFAALCQSQMTILERGMGAVWSAVYLREEVLDGQQPRLIPFAIYPEEGNWQENFSPLKLPEFWQQLKYQPRLLATLFLPGGNESQTAQKTELQEKYLSRQQLILPLIYEDVVMGLLVTGREDRDWNEQELSQIEEIAQTLAIACCLDRRNQWYRQQLAAQQNLRQIEQDRVDVLLHQLRNPLTALRTFSKLLIKRLLPDERNQSVAKNILRESDRLEELLQQFEAEIDKVQAQKNVPLTLSATSVRLSEEDTTSHSNFLLPSNFVQSESVEIKDLLEPLAISAEAIAAERKIKLTTNIPANLPPVAANAKALTEVLNNLIDNAVKYTPDNGRVELSVKIRPEEGSLGIVISDTGYGIAAEDREHVFERHYRGIQARGHIPGSGLGLAIAKELLEQMQGKIELISPNNLAQNNSFPGTTFIVWLPISVNSESSSG